MAKKKAAKKPAKKKSAAKRKPNAEFMKAMNRTGELAAVTGAHSGGSRPGARRGGLGSPCLRQLPPGPPGGSLPLGGPLRADVGHVQQPSRPGQVLDRPGRAEQGGADVVINVVEGVPSVRVACPVLCRAVGQPERAVVRQPVQHVHDGPLVLGDGRLKAQAFDRVGGRREGPDQVGQADLDPRPLEDSQNQAQVGSPSPDERPPAAGRKRRSLGGVY